MIWLTRSDGMHVMVNERLIAHAEPLPTGFTAIAFCGASPLLVTQTVVELKQIAEAKAYRAPRPEDPTP